MATTIVSCIIIWLCVNTYQIFCHDGVNVAFPDKISGKKFHNDRQGNVAFKKNEILLWSIFYKNLTR